MRCTSCTAPVLPVVALDIDGTLGNWHRQWFSFSAAWTGRYEDLEHWLTYDGAEELSDFMELDKPRYRQIKLAFRQGGNKRWMEPYKDAAGFCAMVKTLGVELWITTTRPWMRLDNVDPDTREWLLRQGIKYDGLIYDEAKYERLAEIVGAERVVAVLDNEFEECEKARPLGLHPILRRTSFNRACVPPGAWLSAEAHSFGEAYQMIEQAVMAWRKEHDHG
jgi:hypothetical protein